MTNNLNKTMKGITLGIVLLLTFMIFASAAPTLTLTPLSGALDTGQTMAFQITASGGTGPYTIELYNVTGSRPQGSNVVISGASGTTTIQFNTGATGLFTYNAIARDSGAGVTFNSTKFTINVSTTLAAPPKPTSSSLIAGYGTTVTITGRMPTTGTAPYAYAWLVAYNGSNYGLALNTTCRVPNGSGQASGSTVTCSFPVTNASAVPPGLYNFELHVYDGADAPETIKSPSTLVTVGPILLTQNNPHLITGQTETYTVYLASNITPFINSAGPYNIALYSNGGLVGQGTINSPGGSLALNIPMNNPANYTLYATALDTAKSLLATSPYLSTSVSGSSTTIPPTTSVSTTYITTTVGSSTTSVSTIATTSVSTISTSTTTSTLTTATTTIGSNAQHYILVTITNNGPATSSNFQAKIAFNPSNALFSAYEAANLGNIRFFVQGAPTLANELNSWCESGCTSSSSNAIFWIKLPNGIAANTNAIVNMTFQSTPTNYDGNMAGEAPQLPSTYGQYDNGANIFTVYQNFKGTLVPTGWTLTGSAITINNGASVSSISTTGTQLISSATYSPSSGNVFDAYATTSGATNISHANIGVGYGVSVANLGAPWTLPVALWLLDGGGPNIISTFYGNPGTVYPSTGSHVYSVYYSTATSGTFSYDYGNTQTVTGSALGSLNIGIATQDAAANNGASIYWLRIRSSIAGGATPAAKLGALQQTGSSTTTSASTTTISTTTSTIPTTTTSSTTSSTTSTSTTSTAATTTIGTNAQNYVLITLTNNQGTATTTNLQQLISFNPTTYQTYEASDLGNLRFYLQGAPTAANEIRAWCESGCTSSSSNALLWLKLPNAIGANANTIINMTFQSTSTGYDGLYLGEAPSLTNPYAKYDNGAGVFLAYYNMQTNPVTTAETPSAFSTVTATGPTGVSQPVLQYTAAGSGSIYPYASIKLSNALPSSFIVSSWGYTTSAANGDMGIGVTSSSQLYNGYLTDPLWYSTTLAIAKSTGTAVSLIKNVSYPLSMPNWAYAELDYVSGGTLKGYSEIWQNTLTPIGSYGSVSSTDASYTSFDSLLLAPWPVANNYYALIVARAYPPNGVMLSQAFGSVKSKSSTTSTSPTTTASTTISTTLPTTSTSSTTTSIHTTTSVPTTTSSTTTSISTTTSTTTSSTTSTTSSSSTISTTTSTSTTSSTTTSSTTIPMSAPAQPTITASNLETGQAVTFTTSVSNGLAPYTYNFIIANSNNNAIVASSGPLISSSFLYTTSSTGTFYTNVIVKDSSNTPLTKNSIYSGKFTVAIPLSNPSTPTISATKMDIGQSITITTSETNGFTPYTYSFIISNSITNVVTASSGSQASSTFLYHPLSTGSLHANAIVTDASNSPLTKNSLYSGAFTVSSSPTATSLTPNRASLTLGQTVTYNVIISGGTGPFNVNLVATSNGTVTSAVNGASAGLITFGAITPPFALSTYNVIATDTGASTSFVFNSISNTISVASAPTTITTTSTTSTSTTSTSSTTIPMSTPAQPTITASNLETGQTITFTTSVSNGLAPYTYNFIIANSNNNAIVASSGPLISSSFLYTTSSTGTFYTNVIVKDSSNTPLTKNSIYSGKFTVAVPLSMPSKPTTSANRMHVGQQITFATTVTDGTAPYTYNFIISNNTTGIIISVSGQQSSSSFTFVPQSAASLHANVIVSDYSNTPITKNSIYSNAFNVVTRPSAGPPNPNKNSVVLGQAVIYNATISGGAGPFTANLVAFNGTVVNTIDGASAGRVTFGQITPTLAVATYNVVATDIGITNPESFNSTYNTITVIGAPPTTSSTALTTISTISTSLTTVLTSTISNPGGTGPGGGASGGGGGGSGLPTILHIGACYSIENLTQRNPANVTLNGTKIGLVVNFITPTSAGLTVGESVYTLSPLQVQTILRNSDYNYTLQLANLSYLPIEDTINVKICSSPNVTAPINTTTTNTIFNSTNATSRPVLILNLSGNVTSTSVAANAVVTKSLNFWRGNVSVNTGTTHSNTIRLKAFSVIPNNALPSIPANYVNLIAINVSLNTAVNAINATPSNAPVYLTLGYDCSLNYSRIVPFIVKDKKWRPITPYTTTPKLCTVSFQVPSDPIIALLASNTPLQTNNGGGSSTTTTPTTTIPSSVPSQPQGFGTPMNLAIVAVGIVIIISVAVLLGKKRKKDAQPPPHTQSKPDQPPTPKPEATAIKPTPEQNPIAP